MRLLLVKIVVKLYKFCQNNLHFTLKPYSKISQVILFLFRFLIDDTLLSKNCLDGTQGKKKWYPMVLPVPMAKSALPTPFVFFNYLHSTSLLWVLHARLSARSLLQRNNYIFGRDISIDTPLQQFLSISRSLALLSLPLLTDSNYRLYSTSIISLGPGAAKN